MNAFVSVLRSGAFRKIFFIPVIASFALYALFLVSQGGIFSLVVMLILLPIIIPAVLFWLVMSFIIALYLLPSEKNTYKIAATSSFLAVAALLAGAFYVVSSINAGKPTFAFPAASFSENGYACTPRLGSAWIRASEDKKIIFIPVEFNGTPRGRGQHFCRTYSVKNWLAGTYVWEIGADEPVFLPGAQHAQFLPTGVPGARANEVVYIKTDKEQESSLAGEIDFDLYAYDLDSKTETLLMRRALRGVEPEGPDEIRVPFFAATSDSEILYRCGENGAPAIDSRSFCEMNFLTATTSPSEETSESLFSKERIEREHVFIGSLDSCSLDRAYCALTKRYLRIWDAHMVKSVSIVSENDASVVYLGGNQEMNGFWSRDGRYYALFASGLYAKELF